MKKIITLSLACCTMAAVLRAQNIAINTTGAAAAASAMLDITATDKGLLIPRMTNAQRNAITSPATGLLIYQTDAGVQGAGFYYYNGSAWIPFMVNNSATAGNNQGWSILGNAGTVAGTNFLGTTDAVRLDLRTSNAIRMSIASTGSVGIGTTTPSYLLHVLGDIYANGGWFRVSGNQGIYWESWGGGFYMIDATWIRTYNNKNFYHNTGIMRTDGAFNVGPSGNRFLVQTGGNVGIGTTAPGYLFHMIKSTTAANTAMAQFENTSGNGVALSSFNTSGANAYNAFEGVTQGSYSGTFGLLLKTTGAGYGLFGHSNSWQGIGARGARTNNGGANSGWGGLFLNDLGYTGGVYNASDRKLKKDVTTINNALDKVLKLNPVSYKYDLEKYPYLGLNTEFEYGFIAQEVKEILPDIVREKFLPLDGTKEHVPNSTKSESAQELFLTMDYTRLIPLLTQAIKEQHQEIEALKQRIKMLEEKR